MQCDLLPNIVKYSSSKSKCTCVSPIKLCSAFLSLPWKKRLTFWEISIVMKMTMKNPTFDLDNGGGGGVSTYTRHEKIR